MKSLFKENYLLLAFVLFFAFFLRFFWAINYPITLDEAWSYYAGKLPVKALFFEIKKDSVSPAFVYFVHKAVDLAKTEIGVRWFFVVFNFLSAFFIISFCRKKLLAVFLFSFSFFFILEGTTARMHSLNMFFSSAAIYFFYETFFSNKKINFLLFSVFLVFSLLNFYPMMALCAALFLFFLFFNKKTVSPKSYYWLSFIAVFIVFILSLLFIDLSIMKATFVKEDISSTGIIFPYVFFSFFYGEGVFRFSDIGSGRLFVFALASLIPIYVFFLGFMKTKKEFKSVFSLFVFLISFLIVFLVSLKIPKVLYSPKYLLWLAMPYLYLVSQGLASFSTKKTLFLLIFYFSFNMYSFFYFLRSNPENWKSAASYVEKNVSSNDMVFISAGHMRYPFSFYYSGRTLPLWENEEQKYLFAQKIKNKKILFLIESHDYLRKTEYYRSVLRTDFTLAEVNDMKDIKIEKYEAKGR